MQAHFPSGREITETPYDYTKSVTLQELQSTKIEWITPELIKTVFKLFKSKKSPGTDGIKPIAYKHLPPNIIQHLQIIYKAVIMLEYTPKIWKEAKLIFIPKPGKSLFGDYHKL